MENKKEKFKPFIHNVSINVWQVCYLNKDNYLSARTFKGRHAEEFAKEFLEELKRSELCLEEDQEIVKAGKIQRTFIP